MVEQKIKQGYKITELGIIPKDWNVQNVEDAFEICNNLRFPISKNNRKKILGQYPYYGPTGIQDHINEFRVEGEYALIGEDGDHFLKWQKQPMTILVNGKFNVNNHAHLVKGTTNLTKWFYWFFANRDISSHLTKQGAGRLKLTKKELSKISCIIPPLPEQIIISDVLNDITSFINHLGNLIDKKKNIKQGAMQELLTGKRRLSKSTKPWKIEKLGKYVKFQTGYPFSSKYFNQQEEGIRLVKNRDLKNDNQIYHYSGNFSKEFLVNNNDVLIGMDGDFVSSIWQKGVALLNQRVGRLIPLKKFSLQFAYYYLKKYLTEIQNRTSGTTVKHLSHNMVENIELPLPSYDEQESIGTILSVMDSEIKELEIQLNKYIQLKKGMVQKLLIGEIRLI